MDIQNEQLSLLINLITKYRWLNSLYQRIVDNLDFNFEIQCHITDFYNEFKDEQLFIKAILNLHLFVDKDNQKLIVSHLRAEIEQNINLYTADKVSFDRIDTLRVCTRRNDPIFIETDGQLKTCHNLWQELIQVRNSLESASWFNDKDLVQKLSQEEERLDKLYKKEQEKLRLFYEQQKESNNHAIQYITNQFKHIYELGCTFLSLLDNYSSTENPSTPEPKSETNISERKTTNSTIEPNMIFRTGMHEKLLVLEKKLISDKFLDENKNWIFSGENKKEPSKQILAVFLTGLLENKYFLPNKNSKIQDFFESRYKIDLKENFQPARRIRGKYSERYKTIFYDYLF